MMPLALRTKPDCPPAFLTQVAARLAVVLPAAVVAVNCGGWGAAATALLALHGRSDA